MNIEAEKSELISWINRLKDHSIIQEVLLLKKRAEAKEQLPGNEGKREFGSGKHIFTYIADDFNEPLDDFKEYMPK